MSAFLHPIRCSVIHPFVSIWLTWHRLVSARSCFHCVPWRQCACQSVDETNSSSCYSSLDKDVVTNRTSIQRPRFMAQAHECFTKVPCWGGLQHVQHVDCIPRWSWYWTLHFCRLQMVLKSQAKNHSFLLGFLFARICWISNHLESPLVAFVRIPHSYGPPRICHIA